MPSRRLRRLDAPLERLTSILLPLAKFTCSLTNSTNESGKTAKVTIIEPPVEEADRASCTNSSRVELPSRKVTRGILKPRRAEREGKKDGEKGKKRRGK